MKPHGKTRSRLAAVACLWGLLGLPLAGAGEEPEETSTRDATRVDERKVEPSAEATQEVVIYKPPPRGSPRGQRPGGTRGGVALPRPLALAPDHVAHTLRAAPSLFYHLDGPPPEHARVVLTLVATDAIDPLLETSLPRPTGAGIQRVRLADYGVELAPDVEYEWSVALQQEALPGADDVLSQGYLRRVSADPGQPAPETAGAYAGQGLWYDALEALSDAVDAQNGSAEAAERQRASLLRQAGLDAALP